jgi:hypothetical protein
LIGVLAALPLLLPRQRDRTGYRSLVLLSGFVLLFTVMMSLPPKKFDRYILPIFPALDILAAVGLLAIWQWAGTRWKWHADSGQSKMSALTLAAFSLLLAGNLAWYHPYELAFYNPLLGGGPAAARLIPVGWGEGMAQAGHYITARWNGCHRPVASWFQPTLAPFVCTPVLHLSEAANPGRVDYAVLYIDQMQRNNEPEVTAMLQEHAPVHTVRIHGIDYAAVYQLPRPLAHSSSAVFGEAIRLHSYEIDSSAVRSSGSLTLTLQWQARAPISEDYMLFVHVFDAQGRRIGQIDVPPGGPNVPTSTWQPGHYVTWYHPIPIAADAPAGACRVSLGLSTPQDFARLPLQEVSPANRAGGSDGRDNLGNLDNLDAGANALLLEPCSLP